MAALHNFFKEYFRIGGNPRKELILRMGYANVAKGFRRLSQLMENGDANPLFIKSLSLALGEASRAFEKALAEEQEERRIQEEIQAMENEMHERAVFQPYLHLLHERECPSPIFVIAFTGVKRWKRVLLPTGIAELAWPEQLLEVKNAIINHCRNNHRSPFGSVTGFVYRKTFDDAFEFDILGNLIGAYAEPIYEGQASLTIRGKKLPSLG